MAERGFTPDFTITNAVAAALTRIDRARGFLEAATLSGDWVQAMGDLRDHLLVARHLSRSQYSVDIGGYASDTDT